MKLFPYIIALLLSSAIASWLSGPLTMIIHWFKAKLYSEPLGFWDGLWLAGIESFLVVLFSMWVFSWFGFSIPIFFIALITILISLNNFNRYNTKPNKPKELGYLIGQFIGIPAIFINFINVMSEGVFVFW